MSSLPLDLDCISCAPRQIEDLYPRLIPGGVLFSRDGHLPLCIEVMRDKALWRGIGGARPIISGLGSEKVVTIRKPR